MNVREQRHRLAMEAARLMAREAIDDAGSARRKAARRLGISDRASQPDDGEIRLDNRSEQGRISGLDAIVSLPLADNSSA